MGIGFYKEENDTFALYSSNTDKFLYKGLSKKELVFFYMGQGSKVSSLKNEMNYRLRDVDVSLDPKSYEEAGPFNLNEMFLEGIFIYVMPLKIDEDKYLIYDTFQDSVTDIIISREEALLFLQEFYLNIFSQKYLADFMGMMDKEGIAEILRYNTFDSDIKKEIWIKIDQLKTDV
jgi:hypothetical protein